MIDYKPVDVERVYVTKYWLTKGVISYPGGLCEIGEDKKYVKITTSVYAFDFLLFRLGKDVFLNSEDALEYVEKKRIKKLRDCRKKLRY